MNQPPIEVADIVRACGAGFLEKSRRWLHWSQVKVLNAIARCRTAALGGHRDQCPQCGHQAISFNSCLMGSNSLWGVERGNRRKSNHSKPLFLPIKNLGLPKAGSFRGSDLS
jgi:hypothetical protein